MAENLLSRNMLSNEEVKNYVGTYVRPLINFDENQYIARSIENLKRLFRTAVDLEYRAYKTFGVSSLQELQTKIDDANASGLINLSNEILRTMPAIQEAKDTFITKEDVDKAIDDAFKKYLTNNSEGKKNLDKYIKSLTNEELVKLFNEMSTKQGKTRRRNLTITKTKGADGKISLTYGFSKQVRRSLAKEWGVRATVGHTENDITITYDEEAGLTEATMQRYPYFALSPTELNEAKKNKKLWRKFKLAIINLVNDGDAKAAIKWAMESMGREAFVLTGGSYNDIVGILGELQGLAIMKYLIPNNPTAQARFLGHETNAQGQKIGIDLALNNIGFQVKNYSITKTDTGELINLSGEYTLKNFLDMVNLSLGLGNDTISHLEAFYTLYAYHTSQAKAFKSTRDEMETINRELPRLYHGMVADLLPLKAISFAGNQTMQNVFYLVGGRKILPVSVILQRFIHFLQNVQGSNKILTTRLEYEGPTYTKDKASKNNIFIGYGQISKDIKMHYNVRLSLNIPVEKLAK